MEKLNHVDTHAPQSWKTLWKQLGNIPCNENDEIEEPFEHFEAGTDKFEIWHWFEEKFDIILGDVMFN